MAHATIAGMVNMPSEVTSDELIDKMHVLIYDINKKGLEATFEFEYDSRPITRDNLARFILAKFQHLCDSLSVSHANITVSATTDYVGTDKSDYITVA